MFSLAFVRLPDPHRARDRAYGFWIFRQIEFPTIDIQEYLQLRHTPTSTCLKNLLCADRRRRTLQARVRLVAIAAS
jgi:hypothetical protein